MAGFCRIHGVPLRPDGNCPQCTTGNVSPMKPQKENREGSFPKASTQRRLLGSGVEYFAYVILAAIIYFLGALTGGTLGFLYLLLICLIVIRDFNAGSYSIAKRISQMRVVEASTGKAPSNAKALFRNSYYLALPLIAMFPYFGGPIALFFFMMFASIDIMMILASPRGRRLGDFLAGTQVVEARI
jgi:uncharacterized RDD family membrane protein YckC